MSGLPAYAVPPVPVLVRVCVPMLDIMDQLVSGLHQTDSPHNHHLCILVREWHDLLDLNDEQIQATVAQLWHRETS